MRTITTALFTLSLLFATACSGEHGTGDPTDPGGDPNPPAFDDALFVGDGWALMPLPGLDLDHMFIREGAPDEGTMIVNFGYGNEEDGIVGYGIHVDSETDYEAATWVDVVYELDRTDGYKLEVVSREEISDHVGDGRLVRGLVRYVSAGLSIQIQVEYGRYHAVQENLTLEVIDALRVTR